MSSYNTGMYNPYESGSPEISQRPVRLPRDAMYQIDFSVAAAGKRVPMSKRKLRWRWGFSNKDAVAQGLKGAECRGEEHEITVTWSLTSGKCMILTDGHQVQQSYTNKGSVCEHTWPIRGNHILKVRCFASAPMSGATAQKQYELYINGQPFSTMPKLYEVGIKTRQIATTAYEPQQSLGYPRYTEGNLRAPRNEYEEEADLKRAIAASLAESKKYLNIDDDSTASFYSNSRSVKSSQPPKQEENLLLDLLSDPIPTPTAPPQNTYNNDFAMINSNQPQNQWALTSNSTPNPDPFGFDSFISPASAPPPAPSDIPPLPNMPAPPVPPVPSHPGMSTTNTPNPFSHSYTTPQAPVAPYDIGSSNPFTNPNYSTTPATAPLVQNGSYSNNGYNGQSNGMNPWQQQQQQHPHPISQDPSSNNYGFAYAPASSMTSSQPPSSFGYGNYNM